MSMSRPVLCSLAVLLAVAGASSVCRADPSRDQLREAAPGAAQKARAWLLGHVRGDGSLTDREHENAYVALALLESGAPLTDANFQRLISYLASRKSKRIEFLSLRAELLARALPRLSGGARRTAETVLNADLATVLKNQRDDGVWYYEVGRWPNMDATYAAYQTLLLGIAEGYKVPDAPLTKAVAFFVQRQQERGGWAGNPQDNPNDGTDFVTTMRGLTCLAQVGEDVSTGRTGASKGEEALRQRVAKALDYVRNPYRDWAGGDEKVRDWYFHRQGYFLARLIHSVPMETIGDANLARDWFLRVLRMQAGDGHWETPKQEDGSNSNVVATAFVLYELAQLAKPPLVCEMVEDRSAAVLANRGLWNAVEVLSLGAPRAMCYDRARLGLDYDRFKDVPLAYLRITDAFRLADQEKTNLRRYVASGGTILAQLDGGNRDLVAVAERELAVLWPGVSLEPLQRSHAVWKTAGTVAQRPTLLGLDDGVRTFAFVFQSNAICDLALGRSAARVAAFQTFDNIVHYALEGELDLAARLDVAEADTTAVKLGPGKIVSIGLVTPKPGAEASALPYDGWASAAGVFPKSAGLRLLGPKTIGCADPNLPLCDVAYLPLVDGLRLADDEAAALKAYLAGGGFLLMEARLGDGRALSVARRLAAAAGLAMAAAPRDCPMLTGQFGDGAKGFDVERTHLRADGKLTQGATELRLLTAGDKVVGAYSPRDLAVSASGIRCWGLRGYAPSDARRILANVIVSRSRKR